MTYMNIPNFLTVFRIILIPIFIFVFYVPASWRFPVCATIFLVAGLTDMLDGYLARKLSQVSSLGEFLDPVADKLIVAVALVLLTDSYSSPFFAVPAAIIVCREILISALREWMAEIGKRANVAVSFIGKLKTFVQMAAIVILLSQNPQTHNEIILIGYGFLYVAVILTLWSMFRYLSAAWKVILEQPTS